MQINTKKIDLVIGVPTYNRRDLLRFLTWSLNDLEHSGRLVKFVVLDDCSTDYDYDYLKASFPDEADIIINPKNSGSADVAIRKLLTICLHYNSSYILLLDSDMIISKFAIGTIFDNIDKTEGILALFNTDSHKPIENQFNLVKKNVIGSAGTVFSSKIAKYILENINEGPSFDIRYCKFLRDNNISLYCLIRSSVQHLGYMAGQNSNIKHGDLGNNFNGESFENLSAMIEFLMIETRATRRKIEENSLRSKLKNIEKNLKIIFRNFLA